MKNPFITVAVPTHEMEDGHHLFRRLLDSLWNQSYQNFEIVVTDNSDNGDIERICDWYRTGIRYIKNHRKGMAQNTNEAIKQSKGELIKILYMDDYMAHDNALKNIVKHFDGQWLASACRHTMDGESFTNVHDPSYHPEIYKGNNTIGSPSVITINNDHPLLFDEEMTWLLDCDYYYRMHQKYGEPVYLKDVGVNIGLHEGQMTYLLGDDRKIGELEYVIKKHE